MNRLIILLSLLISQQLSAQNTVSGWVSDQQGERLSGVNIYLKGSYNGTSTNREGFFELSDLKPGDTLIFSMMGFENHKLLIRTVHFEQTQKIKLKEAFNKLKAVSITAGSMEVSDEKQSVVLSPLDVVTTSGALGDVIGALKTLPGTASNEADGRLFVRGGSANETAIFIDGLRLGNAFGTTLSGIPTRSRFSPQLFKGSFFSTGAYSAEFGQALSSVLSLNSIDFPLRRQTDFSLMSVGGSISHTEVWDRQAVTANIGYTNLQPYMAFVPQNIDFQTAPHGFSSELLFRQKISKRGMFKAFYAYQNSGLEVLRDQVDLEEQQRAKVANDFHHLNLNYRQDLGEKHLIDGGISLSLNRDNIELDSLNIYQGSQLYHAKLRYQYFPQERLRLKLGAEAFNRLFEESLADLSRNNEGQQYASFLEADYHFNSDLVLKGGLRYSRYANTDFLMPRASLGYRMTERSSVSLAYGNYVQQQSPRVLVSQIYLRSTQAQHYVVNYQFLQKNHTLRIEAYYKDYQQVLRQNPNFNTNGSGYARGFDLFWRNRGGIRNLDYWFTYSFIDSERHWRHFEDQVQPSFAPRHNASLVTKYWVSALKSQLGSSFIINSGYSYDNPNLAGEMESRTKAYHSLNFSWSYLPKPNFIVHFEITNLLGRENVFGYQYSSAANENGQFAQMAIPQAAKRFIFLGIFYTLSSDKKANQLNNL